MEPHQIGSQKGAQGVEVEVVEGAGEDQPPEGGNGEEEGVGRAGTPPVTRGRFQRTARGLPHEERRHEAGEAGQACDEEGPPPSVFRGHPPADQIGEGDPRGKTEHEGR